MIRSPSHRSKNILLLHRTPPCIVSASRVRGVPCVIMHTDHPTIHRIRFASRNRSDTGCRTVRNKQSHPRLLGWLVLVSEKKKKIKGKKSSTTFGLDRGSDKIAGDTIIIDALVTKYRAKHSRLLLFLSPALVFERAAMIGSS